MQKDRLILLNRRVSRRLRARGINIEACDQFSDDACEPGRDRDPPGGNDPHFDRRLTTEKVLAVVEAENGASSTTRAAPHSALSKLRVR